MAIKIAGTEVINDNKRVLNNESLPDVRPSLLLDFANSKTLDPRITFTRGSTATYWDGKTTAKAEENLYKYSQDFGNSYWTKAGLTAPTGSQTAPDGTSTAWLLSETSNNETHRVYAGETVVAGKTYAFSFYIKYAGRQYVQLNLSTTFGCRVIFDIQNGTVTDSSSAESATITSVGNSWYRCVVVDTATVSANDSAPIGGNSSSTGNGEIYVGSGSAAFYLWGYQREQRSSATAYTATTTSPIVKYQPVLQTAASGEARFDHDPVTGESKGLLIEEARTNLLNYSEDFTQWGKNSLNVESNVAIAPDGTLTADKLRPNSLSANNHFVSYGASTVLSTRYVFSCYVKHAGQDKVIIHTHGNPPAAFNLTTNSWDSATGYYGYFNEDVGNGWYRIGIEYNTNGTNVYIGGSDTNSYGYTPTENYSGILVWGAQVEEGSFPTSYIPTSGSTVTRSADEPVVGNATLSGWYNTNEGTVLAKFRLGFNSDADQRYIVSGGNGDARWGYTNSGDNNAVVSYDGTQSTVTNVTSDNVTSTLASTSSLITLKKNLAVDGNLATEVSASGYMNRLTTELRLGYYGSGTQLNGWLAKVAYYPIAFDRTTLAAMTEA